VLYCDVMCWQAVYELYHVSPSVAWREGEPRTSRVVIIGRRLNKSKLEAWFAGAMADVQPSSGLLMGAVTPEPM
jgi:hypothetical protein